MHSAALLGRFKSQRKIKKAARIPKRNPAAFVFSAPVRRVPTACLKCVNLPRQRVLLSRFRF